MRLCEARSLLKKHGEEQDISSIPMETVDTGIRALCCIPISGFLDLEENAQSGSSDGTIHEISASPSLDRPREPIARDRAPRENDTPIWKQSDA